MAAGGAAWCALALPMDAALIAVEAALIVVACLLFFTSLPQRWLQLAMGRVSSGSTSSSSGKRVPPGPRAWPVVGHLPYFALHGLNEALRELTRRHGAEGLFSLTMASARLVVVSSPELARAVVREQDGALAGRAPPTLVARELTYLAEQMAFADYGPDYRFMRRLTLREMMNAPRVALFKGHRERELDALVASIHHVNRATDAQGGAFTLRPFLRAALFNALAGTALSERFFHMPGEEAAPSSALTPCLTDSEGSRCMHEIVQLVTSTVTIVDLFPSLAFLEPLLLGKFKKRLGRMFAGMDGFLQGVLDRRRREPPRNADDDDDQPRDALDILLSFRHDHGQPLSDRMVKSQIQMMMLAAVDNVAVAVEWVLAELLRHPECARKVQEEMDRVVGRQRGVEEADLPKLPYLRAVVREGARLHPAGATLFPRRCTRDTQLGGYHIPADSIVLVYVCAMQLDSAVWPDAHRFLPERFLDWKGPDIVGGHDFRYMPFGSGRRMCPGLHLGSALVDIALAKLLHSFHWSLPPELNDRPQDMCMLVARTTIASMLQPLRAVLSPRLELPAAHATPAGA